MPFGFKWERTNRNDRSLSIVALHMSAFGGKADIG